MRNENKALMARVERLNSELEQFKEHPEASATETRPESSQTEARPEPGPVEEKPEAAKRFYKVKRGDTLWSISRRTGVPLDTLRELNNIQGSQIRIGQKLRLSE